MKIDGRTVGTNDDLRHIYKFLVKRTYTVTRRRIGLQFNVDTERPVVILLHKKGVVTAYVDCNQCWLYPYDNSEAQQKIFELALYGNEC